MKITKEQLTQMIKEELTEVGKSISNLAVPGSTKSVADCRIKFLQIIYAKNTAKMVIFRSFTNCGRAIVDFENAMSSEEELYNEDYKRKIDRNY